MKRRYSHIQARESQKGYVTKISARDSAKRPTDAMALFETMSQKFDSAHGSAQNDAGEGAECQDAE